MTGRRGAWSGNSEEVTGTAWPHDTKEKEEQEHRGLSSSGAAGSLVRAALVPEMPRKGVEMPARSQQCGGTNNEGSVVAPWSGCWENGAFICSVLSLVSCMYLVYVTFQFQFCF